MSGVYKNTLPYNHEKNIFFPVNTIKMVEFPMAMLFYESVIHVPTLFSLCLFAPLLIFFWPASVVDKPRAHSWRSAIPGQNLLFSSVFVQRSRGSREPIRISTGPFGRFPSNDYYGLPPLFENDFYGLPLQLDDEKTLYNAPIYYWDFYDLCEYRSGES